MVVRIQVLHKRHPCPAHELRERSIARGLSAKRIDGVAQALQVVEDKGHFLEVGRGCCVGYYCKSELVCGHGS